MFESMFAFLDKAVVKNISEMVGQFANIISPLIGMLVTIYFVYLSYKMIFETQKDIFKEYTNTVVTLGFCTFVAFNTEWFESSVVPVVLYIGDDIANMLLSTDTASGASALQKITDSVLSQNGKIWDTIDVSITNGESIVHGLLASALIVISFLGFLPFIAISAAYLMVAKIMVSFLLILAPLYVMFAFFPSTRDMFKSWIGQAVNYILLSVVYPLAFNLFEQLLGSAGMDGNITAASILMTSIVMFALIILATQIPTFTSALSGGIGINGLVGGIGATASGAANVLNPMVNNPATRWAGGKAGQKAASLYNKARGRGDISAG